jgi:hypothetical protein
MLTASLRMDAASLFHDSTRYRKEKEKKLCNEYAYLRQQKCAWCHYFFQPRALYEPARHNIDLITRSTLPADLNPNFSHERPYILSIPEDQQDLNSLSSPHRKVSWASCCSHHPGNSGLRYPRVSVHLVQFSVPDTGHLGFDSGLTLEPFTLGLGLSFNSSDSRRLPTL